MNSVEYFEIQADDTQKAAGFYGEIFGWKFSKQEGMEVEYWQIKTEGIRGGLLKRPTKTPPAEFGTNAFVCSMQVEDFDATQEKILKNGGQVALEKFAVPGKCWQGYFIDPQGNTFGLFQVDENAV
jgi:uncharacterized protein